MADDPGLTRLLHRLRDDDPQVRVRAIHALGLRDDPRAVAALQAVVRGDPAPRCRRAALHWLSQTAATAPFHAALRHALADEVPFVRAEAAWTARRAGRATPQIVDALLEALEENRDAPVAWAMIAGALGALGDRRAFAPLVAYLDAPGGHRRAVAAQALGALGDPRAIPHLTALLEDRAPAWQEDHGPERCVADVARAALGRLSAAPAERGSP